jgi:ABC-type multidrug transport system fused ATPase/permease subunit
MKINTEGVLKIIGSFILAVLTGWIIFWILFWILFISVTVAHIWVYFHPQPTKEGKIKALRKLLESKND